MIYLLSECKVLMLLQTVKINRMEGFLFRIERWSEAM